MLSLGTTVRGNTPGGNADTDINLWYRMPYHPFVNDAGLSNQNNCNNKVEWLDWNFL